MNGGEIIEIGLIDRGNVKQIVPPFVGDALKDLDDELARFREVENLARGESARR